MINEINVVANHRWLLKHFICQKNWIRLRWSYFFPNRDHQQCLLSGGKPWNHWCGQQVEYKGACKIIDWKKYVWKIHEELNYNWFCYVYMPYIFISMCWCSFPVHIVVFVNIALFVDRFCSLTRDTVMVLYLTTWDICIIIIPIDSKLSLPQNS